MEKSKCQHQHWVIVHKKGGFYVQCQDCWKTFDEETTPGEAIRSFELRREEDYEDDAYETDRLADKEIKTRGRMPNWKGD